MYKRQEEDNRPQVTEDVNFEHGMGVSVGRLREDTVYAVSYTHLDVYKRQVSVDMLPLPGGMGISESLYLVMFAPVFGEALQMCIRDRDIITEQEK